MRQIAHGAEAVLYQAQNRIIKERVPKTYRLPLLDASLRKFRTRREAKVLERLQMLKFPAPRLQEFSDRTMSITMDLIPGEKLGDILAQEKFAQEGSARKKRCHALGEEMGEKIALLHNAGIIHGDLTTSNMILHAETGELYFIDFGLSLFSEKEEDKAVDLFLLERALESRHHALHPALFETVLEGYQKTCPEAQEVLVRFQTVQKRGRNKMNKKNNPANGSRGRGV